MSSMARAARSGVVRRFSARRNRRFKKMRDRTSTKNRPRSRLGNMWPRSGGVGGMGAVWATGTAEIGFDYLRPLNVKLGSSIGVPRPPQEQLLTAVPQRVGTPSVCSRWFHDGNEAPPDYFPRPVRNCRASPGLRLDFSAAASGCSTSRRFVRQFAGRPRRNWVQRDLVSAPSQRQKQARERMRRRL
jgi:hypothetical protein